MESHVLNTFHQARYRTIGHKRMGSTSESISSEGSCNEQQNSPDYSEAQQGEYVEENSYEEESSEYDGEYWSQPANMSQANHGTSSDDDDNVEVVEVDNSPLLDDDYDTLVEGADYDIIQVYAVHPDLDLEASSDEEQLEACNVEEEITSEDHENTQESDGVIEENMDFDYGETKPEIYQIGLELSLQSPVVSNVDEYFIKDDPKPILDVQDVKEEFVVKDVDEYFIKETVPVDTVPEISSVDDYFIKDKDPEDTKTSNIVESSTQVEDASEHNDGRVSDQNAHEQDAIADVSLNESDLLNILPKVEEVEQCIQDELYKKKGTQRSFSVPQTPFTDMMEGKHCLSFEDLNIVLANLVGDKSGMAIKGDELPRTLTEEDVNSFLITDKPEQKIDNSDDFTSQDMEIENPVESTITGLNEEPCGTSTPIPKPNVLDFCIEKTAKLQVADIKTEPDDFVDVESCNDSAIPVLAANNLNSLLEQFEANEKFTTKRKKPVIKEEPKPKANGLTNGMRLQDAGVQLNKNKMRQILMPPTKRTAVKRSPSPVHSDHDYCTMKKRHSLPALKGGQSLLKPEVLSSNSRILNSRHRTCKNKRVVYHLSSDDESEKCSKNKKNSRDDSDVKIKKSTLKQPIKQPTPSNCRKKLSPNHSASSTCKNDLSVMNNNAYKASDDAYSQTKASIKLTIKNQSEVILNNCDHEDYRSDKKHIKKCTSSVSNKVNNVTVSDIQELGSKKNKCVNSSNNIISVVKDEPRPKDENFYTALFSNKCDVQIPQPMYLKPEKRPRDEDTKMIVDSPNKIEVDQPQKKKKLNLQEYKLRRSVTSNNSSVTVSPEAIFPDLPSPCPQEKVAHNSINLTPPNGVVNEIEQKNLEAPKKIFDPIREASRKILLNNKKQKAEAMRKRDEDIVMRKIPKVENLELQPLISDAEMLKIVGSMAPEKVPEVMKDEKPKNKEYKELVLVSVGTNTENIVFKQNEKPSPKEKRKSSSPPMDAKALINFKIKKSDAVLKQNVFDAKRRSPEDKKHPDAKIDKTRFKNITAALKSAGKQVNPKIASNSLFASIQDVVMKKAPEEQVEKPNQQISKSPKTYRTVIVRDYDVKADHGEDKIILHLSKHRRKPKSASVSVQTEQMEPKVVKPQPKPSVSKERSPIQRQRRDSDMSMSSEGSPCRIDKSGSVDDSITIPKQSVQRSRSVEKRSRSVDKRSRSNDKRSRSRDKRSRSRGYDKYRRRSRSRSRRRRRSHSRSVRGRRSRSIDRYRRRRRDSPYKRKRTRSPYRRRSPSVRRDYRSNRSPSRSRSRHGSTRSKSPRKSPPKAEKKNDVTYTPPLRKPTVSESSDSSSSSSSASSSSSSDSSRHTPRSCSPRREEPYRRKGYRSYSPEDRDSNKPVEERRIVFVGKLEKDSTKASLRASFSKFGHIIEVRLHNKEDGTRYGFVTFGCGRDAWSAVEAAAQFPQYDVGFGGRRAFCRQSYADLDGIEAEYTESAFHGAPAAPPRRNDMSFEQMLLDVKQKLSQRKKEEDK